MHRKKWRLRFVQLTVCILILLLAGQSVAAVKWSTVSTEVGQSIWGNADGTRVEAQLRLPVSATMDHQGNIYIADTGNHLIRRMTTDGQVLTIAGELGDVDEYGQPMGSYRDGAAPQALFNEPRSLSLAPNGDLYIADAGNGMIRLLNSSGEVTTIAENLQYPSGVVMDEAGNLYVADALAHRILKITPDGTQQVLAGGGYEVDKDGWLIGGYRDGVGERAQFNEPSGLVINNKSDTLYVADTGNQRIRSVSLNGQVETVAGSGTDYIASSPYIVGGFKDGFAEDAQFNFPSGLAVAEDGTLYIADALNHRIRELTPDGQVRTVAGSERHGRADGLGVRARFDQPSDLIVTGDGSLIVVDQWNHSLRILTWDRLPARTSGHSEVRVIWNEQPLSFDVQPRIVQGRTMVPIRQLAEAFGYEVAWDDVDRRVTIANDDQTVYLHIGEYELTGDLTLLMDVAPYIEEEHTFVPLRYISEVFDKHVTWFAEEHTVLLQD